MGISKSGPKARHVQTRDSPAIDTYENIIIGQFLLSLGVRMGLDSEDKDIPWICPSLLQQTNLDTRLGDLLVFNSSFFRVIEFKRASNDSAKEHQKHESLSVALGVPKLRGLAKVSRGIHWYVKSDTRTGLKTWVVPYLDFPALESGDSCDPMDLKTFVTNTAKHASNRQNLTENETEQCRRYLEVVYHSYASRVGTSASSGTLILQTKGGELQNLLVPDILEVLRTPRQIFERVANLSLSMEKEHVLRQERSLARELSLAKDLSHSIDYGYGIGR